MKRYQYGKRLVPLMVFALVMGCKDEVEPPVYQIVPVSARDIIVSVSAAGVIEPIQPIEVKSKASGEIVGVRVETGDAVQRGQLLVSVDPRVPQNALAQAEAELGVAQAQLANAESQLNRAEALYASQSITEQEMENARLQRANANAQLIRAQRSLEDAKIAFEDTEVRAPGNGVILERTVEVGTVISSATREVSGGSVLLRMADLDTVQIRTLVDETDIGKIAPGQDVSITVDAYPNRPFEGNVLKIEPQAVEEQNVTAFPVLVRIPNEGRLLRPGMNAEVEIHVGARADVMAIPNAALRTQRDLASAASVVGLELDVVQQQLAAAREAPGAERRASLGGRTAAANGSGDENTIEWRGRTVQLPEGLTRAQVQPVLDKMQGGQFQSMSDEERSIARRVAQAAGGGMRRGGFSGGERGGTPGGGVGTFGSAADGDAADPAPRFQRPRTSNFQFGGDFIVFVMTPQGPQARPIRTGLTDLDYSEVVAGLDADDRVLILPSASLVQAQEEFQERMNRMRGGGIPGLSIGGRR